MSTQRIALAAVFALSVAACSGSNEPEGAPLTAEEIAERVRAARAEPLDIKGRADLVRRLDQTLNQWYKAQFSSRSAADRELATNLAEVLQTTVYKHYPDVLDFLLHGDDYQKTIAAAAIGFVRPEPFVAMPGKEVYQPAADSTEYKSAIEPLLDLLASENNHIVQNALLGLWRLRDPDTRLDPILRLVLESPDIEVRANAALALTTIVTPERGADAIDVLLTATNDRNPRVRVHAITALAMTHHPAAAGRLLKLLDDPYELIQANCVRAIGLLGEKKNAGALVTRLELLDSETPSNPKKITDADQRRQLLRGYLIESLQELSGEFYGDDVVKWREWWDDEREKARA